MDTIAVILIGLAIGLLSGYIGYLSIKIKKIEMNNKHNQDLAEKDRNYIKDIINLIEKEKTGLIPFKEQ